jgi:hypothetical protein
MRRSIVAAIAGATAFSGLCVGVGAVDEPQTDLLPRRPSRMPAANPSRAVTHLGGWQSPKHKFRHDSPIS